MPVLVHVNNFSPQNYSRMNELYAHSVSAGGAKAAKEAIKQWGIAGNGKALAG